jgi:hypothetical protein
VSLTTPFSFATLGIKAALREKIKAATSREVMPTITNNKRLKPMSNYAILRTSKIKTGAKIAAADKHNSREWHPDNASDTEGGVFRVYGKPDALKTHTDLMTRAGIKPRKNAVLAVEYMATFSPEMQGKISRKEWVKANIAHFKKEHPQGLLAIDLHTDESTDHLHILAAPIIKKKVRGEMKWRLSAKDFFNGKKAMIDLQDRYANAMTPMGLERGVRGSTAHHASIKEFYTELDTEITKAAKQAERAAEKLPDPSVFNGKEIVAKARKLLKQAVKQLSAVTGKLARAEDKIQVLETEAAFWKHEFKHSDHGRATEKLSKRVSELEGELDWEQENRPDTSALMDENASLRERVELQSRKLSSLTPNRSRSLDR